MYGSQTSKSNQNPRRAGRYLPLLGLTLSLCTASGCASPTESGRTELPSDIRDAFGALPAPESVQIRLRHANGVPEFVVGELGRVELPASGLNISNAGPALAPALARIAPLFRLSAGELVPSKVQRGTDRHVHVRMIQMKNGLTVIGGDLIAHLDAGGLIYAVNGTAQGATAEPPPSAGPAGLAESSLVYYRDDDARLHLARAIIEEGVRNGAPFRDQLYLSYPTGETLARLPQYHGIMTRKVHSADNTGSVPGRLVRNEGDAASGDTDVDTNYDLLARTYECYDSLLGRDSYDDASAPLLSTVHFQTRLNNAFSNGVNVFFGDGDGTVFGPLGSDPDVVTHELTHSMTAQTSRLEYIKESGALNESLSDISSAACESWLRGKVVDDAVWLLAEQSFTPGTPNDALRYMAEPKRDGSSRDYYPELYRGDDDNGGVHINSGIPNLAFKLLVTGGTHPRRKTTTNVRGIGVYKAAQIFFTASNFYMSPRTDMKQARDYTVQAALSSLYPPDVVDSVRAAWDAVGVR